MIFKKNKAKTSIHNKVFSDYFSRVSHEYETILNSFIPDSAVPLLDIMSLFNKLNPKIHYKLPFEEDESIFSLSKKGLIDYFKDEVNIIFNNTCLSDDLLKKATLDYGFVYFFNQEKGINLKNDFYGKVCINHKIKSKDYFLISDFIIK